VLTIGNIIKKINATCNTTAWTMFGEDVEIRGATIDPIINLKRERERERERGKERDGEETHGNHRRVPKTRK